MLQVVNYILPLITIPYIVRVFGSSLFGYISFVISFSNYFIMIIEYGFNFYTVQQVSINRGNKEFLGKIFSTVYLLKLILMLLTALMFFSLMILLEQSTANYSFYIVSYVMVLGISFSPQWFLQGVEQIKYFTLISIIIKSIITLMIFFLINDRSDGLIYILLNGIGAILITIISIVFIMASLKIKFQKTDLETIEDQMKNGGLLFISNIGINLYTNTNVFLLGLFTSESTVGYYAAADKIRLAIQGIYYPVSQAIFPHLSYLFKNSTQMAIRFVKRVLSIGTLLGIIITLMVFMFAKEIVLFILGDVYVNSIIVLKILCVVPFIIFFSNIFGIQVMVNLGLRKSFMRIVIIGAVISLSLSLYFVPNYKEVGTSVVFLITEIFITLATGYYAIKECRNILRK